MPNKTLTTPVKQQDWTQVIEPHDKLFDLKLRELWEFRDLVKLFVRRDFVAQYKQTILGPAWHLLSPLFTTIVFTIVFGRIAKISTDGLPQFIFYMAGNVIWAYFAGVLIATSRTFISGASIFGQVYFPRLATPVSVLISKLIAFSIQFVFFICLVIYFMMRDASVHPNIWILLTPVLILMMGIIGLGGGVIVSALTTRYRDLQVLVGFGVSLLMYATPIVYPLSMVPEKYKIFLMANPISAVVETFRYAFLGSGSFNLYHLLYSFIFSIAIFIIGVIMFNKVERTFMDTI
jgi:lipopolysaccharide transport system permease protein